MYCPLNFDICDDICRLNFEEKCHWFFPARPLSEILTPEERLDRLEKKQTLHPKPVYRDEVNQLKGLLTHLHNEVHTLMEEKEAPVKPKRKSKY
uniref:Uncharacterized protein n=1 Tax=viral metagenome TaxID=1070528 RepID=A0A6H2A2C6_9ZZZZ